MNCERFKHDVGHAPRVRELAPQAAQHASDCAPCARWLDEQRGVDELLDRLPTLEPSPGFAQRAIQRALVDEPFLPRLLRSRGLRAAVAVLVLVGAGSAWWVTHPHAQTDLGAGTETTAEPSPELLAEMDLLLDWDVLNQKGEALDAAADADVVVALAQFDVIEDED